jgi:DNA polymerase-3 subunit gamma/tau
MSYLVLARRYRPQTFADIEGQEHVTRTLKNAITRNRVGHAYLFTGLRGVGKTSIARVFAKALNCKEQNLAEGHVEPCNLCEPCLSVTKGNSLSVQEIDGASHNSVDNIRELIESFRSVPPPGYRYKVFIIDEVHMLSTAAFNALLKSLEEPPPFTVFMLATTESHKIPETILSRCQRFDLKALTLETIINGLKEISCDEKLTYEDEALRSIATLSRGSMRDAQSIFEKVTAFTSTHVSESDVSAVLNSISRAKLLSLLSRIITGNLTLALTDIREIFAVAVDPTLFLQGFVEVWRDLLLVKNQVIIDDALLPFTLKLSNTKLHECLEVVRGGADLCIKSSFVEVAIETLILRLTLLFNEGKDVEELPVKKIQLEEVKPVILPSPKREVSWQGFMEFVLKHGNPMMVEKLKRVVAHQFVLGTLVLQGTEFNIGSLQNSTKEKLVDLLDKYAPFKEWRVDFQLLSSDDQSLSKSFHAIEVQQEEKRLLEDIERAKDHPVFKKLLSLYPESVLASS